MSVQVFDKHRQPTPWLVDRSRVAPEYQNLWKGLVVALPGWGEPPIDVGPGQHKFNRVDGTAILGTVGESGRGWKGDATTGFQMDVAGKVPIGTSPRTFVWLCDTPDADDYFWAYGTNSSGAKLQVLLASGVVRNEVNSGNGVGTVDVSGRNSLVLAVSWGEGETSRDGLIHIDGELDTFASGTTRALNTGTDANITLLDDQGLADPSLNAIYAFYVWDRQLTSAEQMLMAVDPYGLVRPADEAVGFVAAVGGLSIPIASYHYRQMAQ